MNSKETLVKLLQENEDAREKFKKLGDVPEEEAGKELKKFEREFGIELKKEDFAGHELSGEKLESVSGGSDAMDWIGLGFDIYGFLDKPDATRRGTKSGSRRY